MRERQNNDVEMKEEVEDLCPQDQIKTVQCPHGRTCHHVALYILICFFKWCLYECVHMYQINSSGLCGSSDINTQLLITWLLFCPHFALFSASYLPGTDAELEAELCFAYYTLSKFFSQPFFSLSLLGWGQLACISQDWVKHWSPRSFPWTPSRIEDCLLGLMTLWQSRGDQFRSTSSQEAPWCV